MIPLLVATWQALNVETVLAAAFIGLVWMLFATGPVWGDVPDDDDD